MTTATREALTVKAARAAVKRCDTVQVAVHLPLVENPVCPHDTRSAWVKISKKEARYLLHGLKSEYTVDGMDTPNILYLGRRYA